jgi:hypothetical protein
MILTLVGSIPQLATKAFARAGGCELLRHEDENSVRCSILGALTNAEKSGLATGMRSEPTISPPAAFEPALERAIRHHGRCIVRDHGEGFPELRSL